MSKLWEIDPETRSKLLEIQKQNGNNACVDCNAPSPQWASPKFGVFMCLNCSGVHRGLGVHISFIRSVNMDQFKVAELKRMSMGGNKPWQDFFTQHKDNQLEGKTFETSTIKDRYDSEAGEEWKDRLTAKVEGKPYVPGERVVASASRTPVTGNSAAPSQQASRSQTPLDRNRAADPSPARSGTPLGASRKTQNEAFFARMGEENSTRPDNVPPSQGGKYAGFGSQPSAALTTNQEDWFGDFQKDPMAGLTKSFGWLGKNAKTGYDDWFRPNIQKLAESDLGAQARLTAAQLGQNLQASSKSAADSFNRFVEGQDGSRPNAVRSGGSLELDDDKRDFWDSFGAQPSGPDPDKQDFWDSFGTSPTGPDKDKKEFWDSFGSQPKSPSKDKKDFWDSFGQAPAGPPADKKSFWDSFGIPTDPNAKSTASSSIGTSAMKKTTPSAASTATKDEDWNETW